MAVLISCSSGSVIFISFKLGKRLFSIQHFYFFLFFSPCTQWKHKLNKRINPVFFKLVNFSILFNFSKCTDFLLLSYIFQEKAWESWKLSIIHESTRKGSIKRGEYPLSTSSSSFILFFFFPFFFRPSVVLNSCSSRTNKPPGSARIK